MSRLTFSSPPRQEYIKWGLLFVGCTLFITIINLVLNGGLMHFAFGRPERTIPAALVLTAFLWLFRQNKGDILTVVLVYLLLLTPTALLMQFSSITEIPPRIYSQTVSDNNNFSIALSILLMLVKTLPCVISSKLVRNIIRVMSVILWVSAIGLPLFFVGYWISHRTVLTPDIVIAVYQTNLSEAWEYLLFKGGTLIYIVVASLLFLMAVSILVFSSRPILFARTSNVVVPMGGVIVLALFTVITAHSNLYRDVIKGAQETVQEMNTFKAEAAKRKLALGNLDDLKNQGEVGLYIVIIGESQSRSRMSAYGYERNTTPWLAAKRYDRRFVLLDNVYTCFPNTVPALSNALTAKNQYTPRTFASSPSVVEIAKAAGYESWWISNQNRLGVWDTPISVIADLADHQIWINKTMFGKRTRSKKFDEELIGEIRRIPIEKDKKRVVFLHTYGCHPNYVTRYPNSFTYWPNTDKKSDAYDNAMRYSDDVLRRIYEVVKDRADFQAMVFVADHGEDVNLGHSPDAFTWDMGRIPMWTAFSDQFMVSHQGLVGSLRANARKPCTNDLFFDLFCGLLGIKNTPYYEESFDISSSKYDRPLHTLKTILGKKNIADDPLLQMQEKKLP